jgi:hypothetical protein
MPSLGAKAGTKNSACESLEGAIIGVGKLVWNKPKFHACTLRWIMWLGSIIIALSGGGAFRFGVFIMAETRNPADICRQIMLLFLGVTCHMDTK